MVQLALPLDGAPQRPSPPPGGQKDREKASRRPAPLWLAIDLPELALEARVAPPERDAPWVVVDGGQVAGASLSARERGVRVGSTLEAARALVGGLRWRERDPRAERRLLERLALLARRHVSPLVEIGERGLLIEVGASRRLRGDGERQARWWRRLLRRLGLSATVAVAPTALAARWLALGGCARVVERREALRSALAALAPEVVGLDDRSRRLLREMGVTRLGRLWRLPREGLARRFGPRLVADLDRALGRAPMAVAPSEPAPRFSGRIELEFPCFDRELLLVAATRLLERLQRWLVVRHAVATRLALWLFFEREGRAELLVGGRAGSAEVAHWRELLERRLEGFGVVAPVVALRLETRELAPADGAGEGLFPGGEEARLWSRTLDLLRARLGEGAVWRLGCRDDVRPERAWRPLPAEGRWPGEALVEVAPRPLWLLRRPRPLAVPPAVGGALPERIESGWWEEAPLRRDYYHAADGAGRPWWCFRDLASGRWYLHGLFG